MTAGTTLPPWTPTDPAGAADPAPTHRRRGLLLRLSLAVLVAGLVGVGLVARLGLVAGEAIGAADNGDAIRLYCVADLVPDTDDRAAPGHGVAVTEYRTGGPGCFRESPTTSAGLLLRATVAVGTALDASPPAPDGSTRFSFEWLAAVYVALFALGAGVATLAATAGRRAARAVPAVLAVVVPPLLPLLVVPWWSRFLVSSFSEPAGLLGAAWLAWGLLALAVTRPAHRAARLAALGLVAVGGLVAATGKPGFVAVGLAAVVACLLVTVGTTRWWRRVPGVVAAVAVVALAAAPLVSSLRAQDEAYDKVNAHNLAFTAVLPEAGPSATGPLGLRPEAFGQAGQHFYLDGGRSVRDWDATVGARPRELRAASLRFVAEHPRVLARMVHRGLVATLRPQVPYLATETAGARTVSGSIPRPSFPEGAQTMGPMFVYLDGLPGRWVPPAVVALALLAGAVTLLPARRLGAVLGRRDVVGPARVAALLGLTALGVVVVAVLGDGYCELAKHVWLASYTLVVTGGVLLVTALAVAGHARTRRG
ncbi:hypothetical protein [Actinomycetospora straminea]|uniref:Membrane protein DUF2142 n=1 Tax=Actinomycetospora straminea TaxID=663607 RepID=A0ABP9ER10_9PSEU|nr:hypothetical protein [Actinomycetospora straminea]MDD7933517.1 hypothetical protein [Actinomycetospora straminea]